MTPKEHFEKSDKTIDKALSVYEGNTRAAQNRMWASILSIISSLELDSNGKIRPTSKNLKTLRILKSKLKAAIVNKQYRKGTNTFLSRFEDLKAINDVYFKSIPNVGFNPSKNNFKEVLNSSIQITKNSLLSSGIDESIIRPVEVILRNGVTGGASISDMNAALRMDILGNEDRLGRLARYSKQITTDSIQQFNANYNLAVSNDLGFEFYIYQGPIIEDSRSYCKERVRLGRWFHIREIELSANEQWSGKIPTTNKSNILINRGGFNCNHQYLPVAAEAVPAGVRNRAQKRGFYTP